MNPSLGAHFKSTPGTLAILMAGVSWILVCGAIDWVTGTDFGVSAFYLPGLILIAWFFSRRVAFLVVCLATLMWLLAEVAAGGGYEHPFVPYWNAFIRFLIFLVTSSLTSEVRNRQQAERAYREQKEILESILDSMADAVVVVESGGIISFNPSAKRLFGSDALGMPVDEWLTMLEREKLDLGGLEDVKNHPLRMAANGELHGYAEIALRDGLEGTRLLLGLTVLPLEGSGRRRSGRLIVAHDLTAKRELDRRISQAGEREARRIGQDLHDGVCQHLVGVGFALGTLQSDLEQMNLPEQAESAGEIAMLVRQAISQAKGLARGLFPVGLDEDLDYALKTLASATEKRTGISCVYEREGDEVRLDSGHAGNLFRIAQEAVFNATQHAGSSQIRIGMAVDPEELQLVVSDNGSGIARREGEGLGIGLQIMQHRANVIGADLKIDTRPGGGTRVSCRMPIQTERSNP